MTAVLLVLTAQLLDLSTFGMAVAALGISGEANPLAAGVYAAGGMAALVALKVAAALALALLTLHVPRRWALLPAAVGIAGAASNILALT